MRVSAAGWLVVVGLAGAGATSVFSLIDQIVLLGIGVVVPLAVGGPFWAWQAAAAAAAVSFFVDPGWAAVFAAPFAVVAATEAGRQAVGAVPRLRAQPAIGDLAAVVASGYTLVGAASLVTSRAGLVLFGVYEPIVELTAVHYLFAGTAALTLAGAVLAEADGRTLQFARTAVFLTAAAPPIVAAGFVTGLGVPQVGGAVLMTIGVWLTGSLQLRSAIRMRWSISRVLLAISGLAIWIPMVLAVAWAAGEHWDVPALSVPDMARTHGVTNALAFSLAGLVARRWSPAQT